MKLGIFDSGHGGIFVAEQLARLLPTNEYSVVNDVAHAPYGERSYDDIRTLTINAIQPLLDCDIIILACNTATAASIEHLRSLYPNQRFIGFEPMIKPAATRTLSKRITLLATKATARSTRTQSLIDAYAAGVTIDIPTTFGWAHAIDQGQQETISLQEVHESIVAGSDTLIIGCTHYIALIPRLKMLYPTVTILEPTPSVARRIKQLIDS